MVRKDKASYISRKCNRVSELCALPTPRCPRSEQKPNQQWMSLKRLFRAIFSSLPLPHLFYEPYL